MGVGFEHPHPIEHDIEPERNRNMEIGIVTVPVSHNGTCFHSGERIGGKTAQVALLIQDGVIKTAFPVHKAWDADNPEAVNEWIAKSEERKKKAAARAK